MGKYSRIIIDAPCKINLYLDITGTLDNGYHTLDMVMQTVSLSDILVISRRREPGIRVTCSRPGVPEDGSNLAVRAARTLFNTVDHIETGLHIHIDKRVPPEAGLGGGSADAAATLSGLRHLLDLPVTDGQLQQIGLTLGADIPFALLGGCARARGIGERLEPLPSLPWSYIVIAKPTQGMSTRTAYQNYDQRGAYLPRGGDVASMLRAVEEGNLLGIGGNMYNIFSQLGNAASTEELVQAMSTRGAVGAALTGSGSAVAGLFPDLDTANSCADGLPYNIPTVFVCQPVKNGPKVLHLD